MTERPHPEETGHLHPAVRIDPLRSELDAIYSQAGRSCLFIVNHVRQRTGTCIPIVIGDTCLLATAAHVVVGCEFAGVFLPRLIDDTASPCQVLAVNAEADVALLASPTDTTPELLVGLAVPERRLLPAPRPDFDYPVLVTGYPSTLFRALRDCTGIARCTYSGLAARAEDWPCDRFDRKLDRRRDLIIPVSPTYELSIRAADDVTEIKHKAESALVPPEGVSGGGIWLAAEKKRAVWSPDASLIGIQVATLLERKYLRGTSIGAWLELAGETFPNLRPNVRSIRRRAAAFWRKRPLRCGDGPSKDVR